MAVRDGIEIALGGEAASRLAKRLAGRQAARLSLVLEPKTVPSEARSGKGAAVRKAAKTGPSVSGLRRVWYVLQAKRGDDNQMEKVLQAAAEAARRSGISRALELLSTPGAQPHTEPAVEPSVSDYRAHEARRWVEARAAFLAEHESVTAPELARLTGSRSVNPSARAHSWAKANRIFSVNDGTGERYPLFQLREGFSPRRRWRKRSCRSCDGSCRIGRLPCGSPRPTPGWAAGAGRSTCSPKAPIS